MGKSAIKELYLEFMTKVKKGIYMAAISFKYL